MFLLSQEVTSETKNYFYPYAQRFQGANVIDGIIKIFSKQKTSEAEFVRGKWFFWQVKFILLLKKSYDTNKKSSGRVHKIRYHNLNKSPNWAKNPRRAFTLIQCHLLRFRQRSTRHERKFLVAFFRTHPTTENWSGCRTHFTEKIVLQGVSK